MQTAEDGAYRNNSSISTGAYYLTPMLVLSPIAPALVAFFKF